MGWMGEIKNARLDSDYETFSEYIAHHDKQTKIQTVTRLLQRIKMDSYNNHLKISNVDMWLADLMEYMMQQ